MCQITLNLAFIGLPRYTLRMHNKKRQQIADKTGERDRKLAAHRMLPLLDSFLSLSLLFLCRCLEFCTTYNELDSLLMMCGHYY